MKFWVNTFKSFELLSGSYDFIKQDVGDSIGSDDDDDDDFEIGLIFGLQAL